MKADLAQRMAAMYREGYTIRQVAAKHFVPYATAHYNMKKQGVTFRSKGGMRRADRKA